MDILTPPEKILNDSRLTPTGNGSINKKPNNIVNTVQPTGGQKWWAAILLGLVFFVINSPVFYYSLCSVGNLVLDKNYNLAINREDNKFGEGELRKLTVLTIVFIIIVRMILW